MYALSPQIGVHTILKKIVCINQNYNEIPKFNEPFIHNFGQKDRLIINQWLMAQMGLIGPMIGQHHQFHHYNPGKSKFGEQRYFKITKMVEEGKDDKGGQTDNDVKAKDGET